MGPTASRRRRPGLFLDNLPSLPLEYQRDVVSVLKAAGQSFRLICSSTVDLEAQVDEGKFDDELFYRVASLPVILPALRDRVEDIPLLVKDITSHTVNPSFGSNQIEFTEVSAAPGSPSRPSPSASTCPASRTRSVR